MVDIEQSALMEISAHMHHIKEQLTKKIDKVDTNAHDSRNILEAKLKKHFRDMLTKT